MARARGRRGVRTPIERRGASTLSGVDLQAPTDDALRALGVRPGERIGAACSGGADSVAMTHLLAGSALGLRVTVLHVDHGLRPGSQADADAAAETAHALGLPVRVSRVQVRRPPRASLEAEARRARYAALLDAADELGLETVATGHTMDDQAETVLLRAMRGGSIAGIARRRGRVIRPLLAMRRDEVRGWLAARGARWVEDPTNDDVRFERNWVRSALLPAMAARRPGVAAVLARAASAAADDGAALDALAEAAWTAVERDEVGVLVPAQTLELPAAVADRVLIRAARAAGAEVGRGRAGELRELRERSVVDLGAARAWRLAAGLAFVRSPVPLPGEVALAPGVAEAPGWGVRVRVGPADARPWRWRCPLPEGAGGLGLRTRRPGDRVMTPAGARTVKDVLSDAGVPRVLRDLVPVLATAAEPLGVVGVVAGQARGALVADAEPLGAGWSRALAWTS